MLLRRPPRGGGVALRQTGAGRMARLWAMSGCPGPKALAAVCENIAEVATSIAIPGWSGLGRMRPMASGCNP